MTPSQLVPVAPDVWACDTTVGLPAGASFPLRMTVLRLSGGALLLHSPVPVDDALAAELASLGHVAYVVAPNRFHHLHVKQCVERYPDARCFGAQGLPEKRPDLPLESLVGSEPPPWAREVDTMSLEGAPRCSEVVFHHRASRTLVTTDLVFNVRGPVGFMTGTLLRMVGAHDKLAASRSWRFFTEDRVALRRSLEAVLSLSFDRLVPAHGVIIETGARAELARAVMRIPGMASLGALHGAPEPSVSAT